MASDHKYMGMHQQDSYVYAFMKADSDVEHYTAVFDKDKFIVYADGKLIY